MSVERATLMADAVSRYAQNQESGTLASVLNPQQLDVVKAVGESWRDSQRGFVKAPTGTGKTVMQLAVIEGTRKVDPDSKTLIVVPRVPLLHQTAEEIGERLPHVKATAYYGGEKDTSGEINITTYMSLILGVARGHINPELYKLVLFDEAHHLHPKRRIEAARAFENALQVGFTATPDYGKNRKLGSVLEKQISHESIRSAVESNRLSSFSVLMVNTGIDIGTVKVKGQGTNKDFDPATLGKAINLAVRNEAAADIYEQAFNGKRALAYCAGVEHARSLADQFRARGIKAEAVSGDQTPKIQKNIIERYKKGEIDVLCNADLLIEGFNDVKTSVVLNLRPTLSPRLAEQRGGRALRIDPDDPSKMAYIVDFIDEVNGVNNPISFAQVAEAAQIVNTWYEHKGSSEVGYVRPVFLNLKNSKVFSDKRDVMWAVNELSGTKYEIEPGWKTLRRISAETGIRLDVVKAISNLIWSDEHAYDGIKKNYTSPRGDEIEHYSPMGTLAIVNWALAAKGYRTTFMDGLVLSPDQAYYKDPDFLRNLNNKELEKIGKRLARVDTQVIMNYGFNLIQQLMESGERNPIDQVQPNDALIENWEAVKADLWNGMQINNQDLESKYNMPIKIRMPRDVSEVKENMIAANGDLFIFPKKLQDGTELVLQVRYYDVPEFGIDQNVNLGPSVKRELGVLDLKSVLVVDAYSLRDSASRNDLKVKKGLGTSNSLVPIAHLDWSEIEEREEGDRIASGGLNLHRNLVPRTDYEYMSNLAFGYTSRHSKTSSHVITGYEKQGIGALMLVASMLALESRGFKWFDAVNINSNAEPVYTKFGISAAEIRELYGIKIKSITSSRKAKQVIERFFEK